MHVFLLLKHYQFYLYYLHFRKVLKNFKNFVKIQNGEAKTFCMKDFDALEKERLSPKAEKLVAGMREVILDIENDL